MRALDIPEAYQNQRLIPSNSDFRIPMVPRSALLVMGCSFRQTDRRVHIILYGAHHLPSRPRGCQVSPRSALERTMVWFNIYPSHALILGWRTTLLPFNHFEYYSYRGFLVASLHSTYILYQSFRFPPSSVFRRLPVEKGVRRFVPRGHEHCAIRIQWERRS